MAFNFPDGASNGDTHTASNGVVYRYNGNQWVIDSAGNNASLDARFLNTKGDGIVSGSSQIFNESNVVSGSAQLSQNISGSFTSVSASFSTTTTDTTSSILALKTDSGSFSSRVTTLENTTGRTDATISGSFRGELSSSVYLQQVKDTISGSFSLSRLPAGTISGSGQLPLGIISGSGQLPSGVISGSLQLPSGLISGSNQIFTSITSSGDISGSGTGSFGVINVGGGVFTSASLAAGGSGGVSSYTDLTNVPSGIISGSGQLPSGTISGSLQLPSGIISGSQQLPSGIISGSLQLPSGLISGSTQISESGFVSSSTTNIIEVMTSASYASITPVSGTLYIIQG